MHGVKAVVTTALVVFVFLLGWGIIHTWPKEVQCADGSVQPHCLAVAQAANAPTGQQTASQQPGSQSQEQPASQQQPLAQAQGPGWSVVVDDGSDTSSTQPSQSQPSSSDVVVDPSNASDSGNSTLPTPSYHTTGQGVTQDLPYNLGANDLIVGQSYGVAGTSGGCKVFSIVGPASGSTSVTDGEWYEYHGIDQSRVGELVEQLAAKQQQYGCTVSTRVQLP